MTRIEIPFAWLLLTGTLAIYLYLTDCYSTMVSSASLMVNLGAACTLSGLLILPAPQRVAASLVNSLASVTTFILLLSVFSRNQIPHHMLLQGIIAVFSINFLLHSLTTLLRGLNPINSTAPLLVVLFTLLNGSSILWLGPPAELFALGDGLLNTIIASNPLSYLSVAAEYDFLRSDWFYRHSPFGSLHFTYPDYAILTAIYLGLAVLVSGVAYHVRTKKQRQ